MSRYLGMANTNEAVWWVLVLTVKLFTDVPMPFSNAAEMVSQQSFPWALPRCWGPGCLSCLRRYSSVSFSRWSWRKETKKSRPVMPFAYSACQAFCKLFAEILNRLCFLSFSAGMVLHLQCVSSCRNLSEGEKGNWRQFSAEILQGWLFKLVLFPNAQYFWGCQG